jgi:small-conductance mechanosensitive channel
MISTWLVVFVLTAFAALGVPMTSFAVVVGEAGLAIGLALKDSAVRVRPAPAPLTASK